MKLARSYNRVNLAAGLAILLITGFLYYAAVNYILSRQLDKTLRVEENEILNTISINGAIPPPTNYKDQQIHYQLQPQQVKRIFHNITYLNEQVPEPGRELLTNVQVNGKNYVVSVIVSRVEAEELIRLILLTTLITAVATLILLYLINLFILGKVWHPFYQTLQAIKNFRAINASGFEPGASQIDEFNELNAAVKGMTLSVQKEFTDLKAFTENASHELMTPVAVMRAKLDSLIQTENLSREQTDLLADIYNAVSRMTRINQALVLLVKIDNRLVKDIELIELDQVITEKAQQFRELLAASGLTLHLSLAGVSVRMSSYLSDIMLNNLFTNAINHNIQNGDIAVELTENQLTVSNPATGRLNDSVFDRFQKGTTSAGTGLGLTIVRQICTGAGFQLSYQFHEGRHLFICRFPDPQTRWEPAGPL